MDSNRTYKCQVNLEVMTSIKGQRSRHGLSDRSSRLHLTIQTHKHVIIITYRPEEQDLCAVTGDLRVSHGAFTYLTFGQLAAEKQHLKENIDIFRSLFEL